MKRDYSTGKHNNVTYFVGIEVEKTPALGQKTLFVTGLCSITETEEHATSNNCKHIFFGANHSFIPFTKEELNEWFELINYFLQKDYLCSLDIPVNLLVLFLDTNLKKFNQYSNFIPQIRVPIPHIEQWNKNTMIKIDDIGFNKTNLGIWTHNLNKLVIDESFTSWQEYNKDKIIK